MHYDFPGKPFRNIELSIVHPRGGNNDVQFVNYDWNTTCNREYKVGRADYIFSHAQKTEKQPGGPGTTHTTHIPPA